MQFNNCHLLGINETNNVEHLNIPEDIIYNKRNNKFNQTKSCSLNDLDLFTTRFDSLESLLKHISIVEEQPNNYKKLFIAAQDTIGEVKYFDVLYKNDKYVDILKSLIGKSSFDNMYVNIIVDSFSNMINSDLSFYRYVVTKHLDIYLDYLKEFSNYRSSAGGNEWYLSSYHVLRRLAEIINSYKNKDKDTNNFSFDFNTYSSDDSNEKQRDRINHIVDFVMSLDDDTFVYENGSIKLNSVKVNFTCEEDNQFELIGYKIRKMMYLVSVTNSMISPGDKSFELIRDKLIQLFLTYLKDNKDNVNIVYSFTLLYNKYKKQLKGKSHVK